MTCQPSLCLCPHCLWLPKGKTPTTLTQETPAHPTQTDPNFLRVSEGQPSLKSSRPADQQLGQKSWRPDTLGCPTSLKPELGQVLGPGKAGIVQNLHRTSELL